MCFRANNILERFDLRGSTSSREPRSTAANKIERAGFEGRCRGVLIVSLLLLLVSDTLDSDEFDTVMTVVREGATTGSEDSGARQDGHDEMGRSRKGNEKQHEAFQI